LGCDKLQINLIVSYKLVVIHSMNYTTLDFFGTLSLIFHNCARQHGILDTDVAPEFTRPNLSRDLYIVAILRRSIGLDNNLELFVSLCSDDN
jgi:hypothetical protein